MKNSRWRIIIHLVVIISFLGFSMKSFAANMLDENLNIRVGLHRGISSVRLASDGNMIISDAGSGAVLAKVQSGNRQATLSGNKVYFAGTSATRLRITNENPEQVISVSGKRFRGEIELMNRNGTITVVNVIGIDQYLYGVLPAEMVPSWPIEALKAQAVAARTYALHNGSKHASLGFDVCTTTDCQVYRGYDGEAEQTNRAVDATRGEVLTYQGEVILAVFHSSGGGYTENSENVWSSPVPYLRGVRDFDQDSTHYSWSLILSPTEFSNKLQTNGYSIGRIQAIQLSPMKKSPQGSADRGVSGRVIQMTVVGSRGTAVISGTKLRTILGLKSTCFDIYLQESQSGVKLHIEEASDGWSSHSGNQLIIEGSGWGHGLGLSQWGAKAYAEENPSTENLYVEILTHYYSGAKIEKMYR